VSPLNWQVRETHTAKALHLTKNGSTTGMDSCPYKLWKALQKRHEETINKNQPIFDIINILIILYKDIQTFRVDENTDFTLG
jgi:hypothetical protein